MVGGAIAFYLGTSTMLLTSTTAWRSFLACCGEIGSLTIISPQATAIHSHNSQAIAQFQFSDNSILNRKNTEYLDDETEKIISRYKPWFLVGAIVFIWMAYQSLTIKHK
jgi:hypothetical protein